MTDTALPPLPSPRRRGAGGEVLLAITPGEHWCAGCGSAGCAEDAAGEKHCVFCGSRNLVAATNILRPGEYIVNA